MREMLTSQNLRLTAQFCLQTVIVTANNWILISSTAPNCTKNINIRDWSLVFEDFNHPLFVSSVIKSSSIVQLYILRNWLLTHNLYFFSASKTYISNFKRFFDPYAFILVSLAALFTVYFFSCLLWSNNICSLILQTSFSFHQDGTFVEWHILSIDLMISKEALSLALSLMLQKDVYFNVSFASS